MIKFIRRLRFLKLDYLIWKCERTRKKLLKVENELKGSKNG